MLFATRREYDTPGVVVDVVVRKGGGGGGGDGTQSHAATRGPCACQQVSMSAAFAALTFRRDAEAKKVSRVCGAHDYLGS